MPKGVGKLIAQNKKARHDYFIEDTFEAGIVLQGTEIKSVRAGKVSIKEAYSQIKSNEAWIHNMNIAHYEQGNRFNHDPLRSRKILLHRKEINKLIGYTKQGGYTLIPLKVYISDGFAKVELGVGRGKKLYDKRQDLKNKDAQRQIDRAMKSR